MITITNSELSTIKRCERNHYYRYVMLRTVAGRAQALADGTAVHEWLEDFWLPGNGQRIPSSPGLRALCKGYQARYLNDNYETLAVEKELTFTINENIRIALKLDGLIRDADGKLWVLEHKTSSQDTSAGSQYWQALRIDTQISTYVLACHVNGIEVEGVLYDVLDKPRLKQLQATPEADRKYTKAKKDQPSRLYAGQRDTDETDGEFEARVIADIAEDPDKYYRREFIRVSDEQITEAAGELREWALRAVMNAGRVNLPVRNSAGCMKWGRLCDYFPVCSKATQIESYPVLDRKHQELSEDL